MEAGQWLQLGTGSGFLVDGLLVTCAHNIRSQAPNEVTALFPKGNWQDPTHAGVHYYKPLDHMKAHSSEHSFDYAVLECVIGRPGLGLSFSDRLCEPGEPVCSLGYAFDGSTLIMHQGIVASVEKSGVATMLTLDMSVNPGNSGGPLISLIDGKVVGVVVRKATGLDKAFDQLTETMQSNIDVLAASGGGVQIGGIDAMAAFTAIQTQMLKVAKQIQRSAMVGIGYAIFIDPLRNEPVFHPS
jgi:S1-C subfamily serine protease